MSIFSWLFGRRDENAVLGSEQMAALESELFLAVKNQDIGKVTALLKRGVSSNAHLEDEWTCLHEAATTGPAELLEMLIKHGANLETKGGNKLLTPLHVAALHGQIDAAEVLVKHGANTGAVSKMGRKPCDYAASLGNRELAALLTERG